MANSNDEEKEKHNHILNGDYLESHQIYDLFRHLLSQTLIHKPEDHLAFLIKELSHSPPQNIIIFGSPGGGKSIQCTAIEKTTGCIHVSPGHLLQEMAKGDASLMATLTSGGLVEDSIVCNLLIKRLQKSDCQSKGWVINNFPATLNQATLLQEAGLVPTKFIYLDLPDSESKQRLTTHKKLSTVQSDRMLATYRSTINMIVSYFKDLIFYVDGRRSQDDVALRISEYLSEPVLGLESKVAQRIVILGPVGSGRSTQARLLSRAIDAIHINTAALLREHLSIASDDANPEMREARDMMASGNLVSDSLVISLLAARLSLPDVCTRSFVLDGFPRTLAQLKALDQLNVPASRVIMLTASDAAIADRLACAVTDRTTGEIYHLHGDPLLHPSRAGSVVEARCVPVVLKTCAAVSQIVFRKHVENLKRLYQTQGVLHEFDALIDVSSLHSAIRRFVQHPIIVKQGQ